MVGGVDRRILSPSFRKSNSVLPLKKKGKIINLTLLKKET